MGVLSDREIALRSDPELNPLIKDRPLIFPFVNQNYSKQAGLISYGCGACGYDVRISGDQLKLVSKGQGRGIRPGDETVRNVPDHQIEHLPGGRQILWIEPGQLVRARTVEQFNIPRDLDMVPYGKSSYTRNGLDVHATIGDPGWGRKEGEEKLVGAYYTLSLTNSTNTPLGVFLEEGILQMQFEVVIGELLQSYADKGGKYMGAAGIEAPKLTEAVPGPDTSKPLTPQEKRAATLAANKEREAQEKADADKAAAEQKALDEESQRRTENAGNN